VCQACLGRAQLDLGTMGRSPVLPLWHCLTRTLQSWEPAHKALPSMRFASGERAPATAISCADRHTVPSCLMRIATHQHVLQMWAAI
jgi:hypothetical protein